MSELRSRIGKYNPALRSPKLSTKFTYVVCVASGFCPKSMELKKKKKILLMIPVNYGARSVLLEHY